MLRRGFKSDANWYARDVRRELGLPLHAPICPWELAKLLAFEVHAISAFIGSNRSDVSFLTSVKGSRDFSVITVCVDQIRAIIHNDSHTQPRQAANIAHELAHGLLLHPSAALSTSVGARHFDANQEAEASWLGPALLVSDEAAMHIVKSKMRIEDACKIYGVSLELLRMRLNVSGANFRVARSAA